MTQENWLNIQELVRVMFQNGKIITYPDISLLLVLADTFEVTVDALLDANVYKKEHDLKVYLLKIKNINTLVIKNIVFL